MKNQQEQSLELKNAELEKQLAAKNRELEIEAALERVRARTMAMQHSDELSETAFILFQQFKELGENPDQATIGIINEAEHVIEYWVTMYGSQINKVFKFSIDEPNVTHKIYKGWKAKKKSLVIDLSGKALTDFAKYRESMGGAKLNKGEKHRVINVAFFSKGLINVQSNEERSEESIRLLERFAGVFDGAYTRFLDLKKAEAQAREARIELSLERVRASAMAMHKTEDLHEAGALLFKGLAELGINTMAACYALISEDERSANYYGMNPVDGKIVATPWVFPHTETEVMRSILASWKKHDAFHVIELDEQDTLKHHTWAGEAMLAGLKKVDPDTSFTVEAFLAISPPKAVLHTFNFPQGYLFIATGGRLTTEQEGIALRFTKVFEMTYRRFLDLQKAEAQARESQIELALERVRARTMAMQKSEELKEIIKVVYEQLVHLNILAEHAGFIMDYRANDNMNIWLADKHFDPSYVSIPYFDSPHWNSFIEAKKKGTDFFANLLNFEEKNKFYQDLFELVPGVTDEAREFYLNCPGLAGSTVLLDNVGLYIENFSGIPYTDEENSTLMRFGKVFQQTYTRFLDLQKAEAQAREAQIELSLERVRASAMAMHNTDQLLDAAELLYKELTSLGISSMAVTYSIMAGDEKSAAYYSINPVDGKINPIPFDLPHTESEVMRFILSSWKKQEAFSKLVLDEEATLRHQTYIAGIVQAHFAENNFDQPFSVEAFLEISPKKAVIYTFNFAQGYIFIIGSGHLTKPQEEMVTRFAKVFEMTYRRFLDLKQAEEQARESQIQLALERVRARTMAMQHSEELAEAATVLFQQLHSLDIAPERVFVCIPRDESRIIDIWGTEPGGKQMSTRFEADADATWAFRQVTKGWEEKKPEFAVVLKGKHLEEHINHVTNKMHIPFRKELVQGQRILYCTYFSRGFFVTITPEVQPEETRSILQRFAAVFDQTYTRFKDLKQAEAQARESQIQLGLERVRAKAMAMQTSEELNELIGTVFSELTKLDFVLTRCLIMIFDPETKASRWWMANSEAPAEPMNYLVQNHKNPAYDAYLKAWEERDLRWNYALKGKVKRDWDDFLFADTELAQLPAPVIAGMKAPEQVLLSASFNNFGCLTLVTLEPLPDEHSDIMLRFAKVFDMCYTRFNDLKQAEEQAREAKIEASLERVRSRTMAMQHSDELRDVIQVIYEQLHQLNFNIDSADFNLDYRDTDDFNLWIGVPGQPYPAKMHVPYIDHPVFNRIIKSKGKVPAIISDCYTSDQKNTYFRHNFKFSPTPIPAERQDFIFSGAGLAISTVLMTNVALSTLNYSGVPYTDADNATLMRFGKVFEQTYTRFKDLEQAEAQAKESQIQLALERVRARTMAMQNSGELHEVIQLIYDQLHQLNFNIDVANFTLNYRETDDLDLWLAVADAEYPMRIHLPYFDHPIFTRFNKAKEKGGLFTDTLSKPEKNSFFKHFFKYIPGVTKERQALVFGHPGLARSAVFMKNTVLTMINYQGIPFSEAENNTLLRFGQVFDQTYTRFSDLEQAEAQAREAKIQLGLERVRARAMAMQSSGELAEVVDIVFKELTKLDFGLTHCAIAIADAGSVGLTLWQANSEADQPPVSFYRKSFDHPYPNAAYKEWKKRTPKWVYHLKGAEKKAMHDYYASSRETMYVPNAVKEGMAASDSIILSHSFNNFGYLRTDTTDHLSENNLDIVYRFAKAFDLCYTRFTDIKQAEAQAKEAQTQLALERVRARTMAMQRSEELAETAMVLFQQLYSLDVTPERVFIGVPDDRNRTIGFWGTEQGGTGMSTRFEAHADGAYSMRQIFEGWEDKKTDMTVFLSGEHLDEHINYVANIMHMPVRMELVQDHRILYCTYFSKGMFVVVTPDVQPEETLNILKRFAAVFDQTYTRFLDLQKAEAQAREGQIQLGLERVRAAAMAMHDSNDVGNATALVFSELYKLGITTIRCGVCIIDGAMQQMEVWSANSSSDGKVNRGAGKLDMKGHPLWLYLWNAWKQKKSSFSYELKGKELADYYKAIKSAPNYEAPEGMTPAILDANQYCNCYLFNEGCLFTFTQTPFSPETGQVLEKFAAVFGLTYRRYLDLTKAEAQAREAQIEAALEKVRSKAMAMHNSDDLSSAASLVFTELRKLGITAIRCGVGLFSKESPRSQLYSATISKDSDTLALIGWVDMVGHPVQEKIYNGWLNQEDYFPVLNGKELKAFYKKFSPGMNMPSIPGAGSDEKQYGHFLYFTEGALNTWAERPYSEPELKILDRFKSIISLTFRRYLDLKKAEAQAREAQIEAALERVRSKTMAMHNSEDVADTVATMFNELVKLGVEKTVRCGISIIYDNREMELWRASYNADGKADMLIGRIDMRIHSSLTEVYQAWKNNDTVYSCELTGNNQQDYFRALNDSPTYPVQFDLTSLPVKQTNTVFFFPEGCLFAFTLEPLAEETVKLFKRFAGVFGQTYRRYLDLLKAEASAREAQIEAALERVRSKTMAMHNSADVGETVTLMFNELIKLGVEKMARCGIAIPDDKRTIELWTAKFSEGEKAEIIIGHIDTGIHPMLGSLYDAWKSKQPTFEHILKGDDLVNYITALNNSAGYPIKYDMKAWGGIQYHNDFFFAEGMVFAFTFQPLSAEIAAIFKRFAGVFGQTYRRYLDLQKAENQAREAQIEAALERVRSKAMAMRSSGDLNDTANTVFIELRKLGVDLVRCGLGLMEKETHISTIHAATNSDEGGSLEVLGNIDMNIHPVFEGIYNQWRQNKDYFPVLEGESLKAYYEKLHESGISVPEWKSGEKQYGYFLQFAYGSLYAWSGKQESEITIKTLKRFTSVIALTYTRYIELQKAESNTKDAIKQASLDRVRAEIASMRKRSDLERITPLIWDELTILGIPFIRCGVFIMDEEQKLIHTFLSTPDGKAIGAFHIPFDTSGNFEKMVNCWRNKEPYIDHWKEEAFSQFADTLLKQGAIASKAQYMRTLPHEGVHLNFLPFLQGMLYVGNIAPLAEDHINLIQSVAEAFSTAYARYEDFNKLEAAKQQVDNTLTDLKATQTRLIQSEKMASLGELTAGIAHEIQNPLNFVNNFSEVNQEMIDELADELKAGHIEEALAIAADIRDNEEKINHHGKRADGIVKGMLQHSRTGGGEKEQTNINTLADEFLRLSYHGLRAKDKEFNAELVTHFDEKLPKVTVIPQDIGRVLLNLFNNAFYAVNQKKKALNGDFKPEVTVTTLIENGQLIIKVKDNGVGMPEHIKEKIMQPFFTTKPTGEGTGLGLSLTYDMVVKGHGGTIQVNSVEGEGSEFIISIPI